MGYLPQWLKSGIIWLLSIPVPCSEELGTIYTGSLYEMTRKQVYVQHLYIFRSFILECSVTVCLIVYFSRSQWDFCLYTNLSCHWPLAMLLLGVGMSIFFPPLVEDIFQSLPVLLAQRITDTVCWLEKTLENNQANDHLEFGIIFEVSVT